LSVIWEIRSKTYLEKSYDLPFGWVEQRERKGLGHAVGMGIEKSEQEPLLIILGDTIFETDLSMIAGAGRSTIGVKEVADPSRFGVVELEDDRVVKLVEKPADPRSNLAIVGLYYIEDAGHLDEAIKRLIAENIQTKGEYQLTDALQLMIEDGKKLGTFQVDGWFDCGKPETLLSTNAYLLEKSGADFRRENCLITGSVYLSPEAEVRQSLVGPDVSVSQGASIRRSIIRNSIICEDARVTDAVLEDSIVGPGAAVVGEVSSLNLGRGDSVKTGGLAGLPE